MNSEDTVNKEHFLFRHIQIICLVHIGTDWPSSPPFLFFLSLSPSVLFS